MMAVSVQVMDSSFSILSYDRALFDVEAIRTELLSRNHCDLGFANPAHHIADFANVSRNPCESMSQILRGYVATVAN